MKFSENSNLKIGVILSYITLGVSILGALFVTPKILMAIGDVNYGLYSFANSITSWLSVISAALASSYIRFAAIEQKEFGKTSKVNTIYTKLFILLALIILLITVVGCGGLYFFNFQISKYTADQNKLIILLLLISGINISITILASSFQHYCTYKKQFIFTRTLALIISFSTYVLNLIFALITKSVVSISIIATCLSSVTCIVSVIYSIKKQGMDFEKVSLKGENQLFRKIVIFSSFVLLNTIVDQINNNVDKTLLGSLVNAESVTYYSLAKYFNAYLLTLSTSISGVFAPKIHDLVQKGKKEELNSLFLKVSKTQSLIIICVIFGYIACGRYFIYLWLGQNYGFIYYYACVLLFIDIVPLTINFGIEVQRAMNKHKFRAILYIVLAFVNVGISVLLILLLPRENAIWGAIIGTVFSVVIGNWVILNIYNKKSIGLPVGKYFINIGKIGLFGIGASACSILVDIFLLIDIPGAIIKFLICGFTFVFIYLILLFIFERKTLKSLIVYLKRR